MLGYRCNDCWKLGAFNVVLPMEATKFAKMMMRVRCQHCGSKKLLMGQRRTLKEDRDLRTVEGDIAVRLTDWRLNGETGVSALAIADRMSNVLGGNDFECPKDAESFGRCLLLLDRIPEWKAEMHAMSDVSDGWAAIVAQLPDLVATYEREAGEWWMAADKNVRVPPFTETNRLLGTADRIRAA